MDKNNNVSEKGQIVTASLESPKVPSLVECSRSETVSIYQKWFMEGTMAKQGQGHGWQRHIDACGE